MKGFKELQVWQKSIDLCVEIYKIAQILPKEELYNLSSQLKRAAVSVPSNIAEGHERNSIKEYIQFLYISRGSLSELETQLYICNRLKFLSADAIESPLLKISEIGKMLNGLIKKLRPDT